MPRKPFEVKREGTPEDGPYGYVAYDEQGKPVAFSLGNHREVFGDLTPTPVSEKVYRAALQEHIMAVTDELPPLLRPEPPTKPRVVPPLSVKELDDLLGQAGVPVRALARRSGFKVDYLLSVLAELVYPEVLKWHRIEAAGRELIEKAGHLNLLIERDNQAAPILPAWPEPTDIGLPPETDLSEIEP